MTRKRPLLSIEFLGLNVVPMTKRPRRAQMVINYNGLFVAQLSDKKVAVSSREIFSHAFPVYFYEQRKFAEALVYLGMISQEMFRNFIAKLDKKKSEDIHSRMVNDLQAFIFFADRHGIDLTAEQSKRILKITGMDMDQK